MKYLILILMLFTLPVQADTLNWTWNAPTARTDGTAFDMATEGAGYHVWFNGVQEVDSVTGNPILLQVGANTLSKTFASGNQCAEFTTVDSAGRESARSPPSCKDVFSAPGVPSNVTVTITVGS